MNTLTVLMVKAGYTASNFAGIVEIEDASLSSISEYLKDFVERETVTNTELANLPGNNQTEKYDHLLPESLLDVGYGAKAFDVDGTKSWLAEASRMNLLEPK